MNIKSFLFFLALIGLGCYDTLAQNIRISDVGNPNDRYPNEPSIMMDPDNSNIMVVGSNLNYYYRSN